MDTIHVDRSYWYELSIAGMVFYMLLAPAIAARAADLRIVAALPVLAQTGGACYAVLQLLRVVEAVGHHVAGIRTVAAGLSEAVFLWSIGAAVSCVCSVVIAAGLANLREQRTRLGSLTLAIAVVAAAATGALMLYLARLGPKIPPGPHVAAAPLTLSVIGVVTAVGTLVWPWDRQLLRTAHVRWLWTFAGITGTLAALMILVSYRLTAFAAGR